jgi:hypothetical protein
VHFRIHTSLPSRPLPDHSGDALRSLFYEVGIQLGKSRMLIWEVPPPM